MGLDGWEEGVTSQGDDKILSVSHVRMGKAK